MEEEKEEVDEILHVFESIGHLPLWGRCPKGLGNGRSQREKKKWRENYTILVVIKDDISLLQHKLVLKKILKRVRGRDSLVEWRCRMAVHSEQIN